MIPAQHNDHKKTSKELKNEAEHLQDEIKSTVNKIEDRLDPKHVIDDVVNQFDQDGSIRDFVRNARESPIGSILISMGALMMSQEHRRVGLNVDGESRLNSAAEKVRSKTQDLKGKAEGNLSYVKDTAVHKKDEFQAKLDDAHLTSMNDMGEHHPYALAALGFALGAIMGGVLPKSEKEEQVMHNMKQEFSGTLDQQKESLKGALKESTEKAMNQAADEIIRKRAS